MKSCVVHEIAQLLFVEKKNDIDENKSAVLKSFERTGYSLKLHRPRSITKGKAYLAPKESQEDRFVHEITQFPSIRTKINRPL